MPRRKHRCIVRYRICRRVPDANYILSVQSKAGPTAFSEPRGMAAGRSLGCFRKPGVLRRPVIRGISITGGRDAEATWILERRGAFEGDFGGSPARTARVEQSRQWQDAEGDEPGSRKRLHQASAAESAWRPRGFGRQAEPRAPIAVVLYKILALEMRRSGIICPDSGGNRSRFPTPL